MNLLRFVSAESALVEVTMSESAAKALEEVRRLVLDRQQVCAWCEKVCRDANHLYFHIVLRHKHELR
jgi:hypothetical protein